MLILFIGFGSRILLRRFCAPGESHSGIWVSPLKIYTQPDNSSIIGIAWENYQQRTLNNTFFLFLSKVYLLIKNNHISVIKRKVYYKHYVKNYSTRPDIRQWSVVTSVLQNLDIFGTRISKYTVKQITGPKVASLLPQAQYSWGYHRLYAAIHHSKKLLILNSIKWKYPRKKY